MRRSTGGKVNGLTGKEFNPVNPFDPHSPIINVSYTANDIGPDGGHSVPSTTIEVFGGLNMTFLNPAPMNGFIADANIKGKGLNWGPQIMAAWTAESLPILSTLASEYAVFDAWHSSIPGMKFWSKASPPTDKLGPTEVNRAYLHSSTSDGCADGTAEWLTLGFPQKTLFQQFDDVGKDWGVFFELLPSALFMRQLRERMDHFHSLWDFESLCLSGKLPTYSFLEPRWYSVTSEFPANDQHPDHAISEGEKLIKWVYETVRASPVWNETALIILYDEHGGYYDHVPTPLDGIPNPDGKVSPDPAFDFTRLGIRVPMVVVSPWVNKGTVVHEPKGPTPTSHYEHSSIEVNYLYKNLTLRDEWAGTFEHIFQERTSPRTDCPENLPPVPQSTKRVDLEPEQKLNDLQKNLLVLASALGGVSLDEERVKTEYDGAIFSQKQMESLFHSQGVKYNKKLLKL